MEDDLRLDLVRLQEQVRALAQTVSDDRTEAIKYRESTDKKLDTLISTFNQLKGGWSALSFLVVAAGAVGAAVTWLLSHVTLR